MKMHENILLGFVIIAVTIGVLVVIIVLIVMVLFVFPSPSALVENPENPTSRYIKFIIKCYSYHLNYVYEEV